MTDIVERLAFHSLEVAQHYDNAVLNALLDEAAAKIKALRSEVAILREQIRQISRKYAAK